MSSKKDDAWYAAKMMDVVHSLPTLINTFSDTEVKFILLAESADDPNLVHKRTGTFQAKQPELLTETPDLSKVIKMGQEISIEKIRAIVEVAGLGSSKFIKYEMTTSKDEIELSLLHKGLKDSIKEVKEAHSEDTFVIVGDEKMWEVSLINFVMIFIQKSLNDNLSEFHANEKTAEVFNPQGLLQDRIEDAFQEVLAKQKSINDLSVLLTESDKFNQYEDRFFALLK